MELVIKLKKILLFRSNANPITIRGSANKYGFAYCGPTMNTLNRFALSHFTGSGGRAVTTTTGGASDSTVTTSISPMRLDNFADFRLTGTYNTSLDDHNRLYVQIKIVLKMSQLKACQN